MPSGYILVARNGQLSAYGLSPVARPTRRVLCGFYTIILTEEATVNHECGHQSAIQPASLPFLAASSNCFMPARNACGVIDFL
jgi:hypothetical protein